ncbi:MAG: hypothetical protein GWO00_15445, partial [Gemmatimonadetes bacterium]|nr:hypothetical protein [Gemmatimonadota bacterium]NIU32224.1 hypothetical protein [Gemmatimonadota bacterium]NIW65323.1 hypothetical protein [Gemmatimonadota bacterium]NIX40652.1 hypothetical protein [Gemmatimonadota bacterium]
MHKGQLGQATRAKALWSELRRRGREWFKDAPNRQARVKKILLTGDPGAESWQLALAMATKRTLEAVKRAEWDGRGRVPPTVRILEAELETRGTSKMYPPSAWAPASKTRANPLHPKDAEAFALLSRPLETKEDVEAYRELLKQFPPVVLMRFVYSSTAGQGRDLWADTAGRRRWYLLQAELEKKGLLPEEADWWVEALAFLGKNDIPLGPEMATPLGYPTWYQPMGNDVFAHWWGEYQEDPESFVEHF